MQRVIGYALTAMALTVATPGCRKPPPRELTDVVVVAAESLPAGPADKVWTAAPELVTGLILQDQVDPRLLAPSTRVLRVRAVSDGARLAFRLEWSDPTRDDLATPDMFADACAVQLPAKIEPTVPAPQMGEKGRPVHIAFWSAAWQAAVEGRGDSLTDLYPNASVDHYPFEAPSLAPGSAEQQAMAERYAPARALGNFMAGPRDKPVQDLIAEGPGTLTAAEPTTSEGLGERSEDGWAVVIAVPLPEGFDTEIPAQAAFAVWEGSRQEVGSRKMRTGWITLSKQEKP